MEFRTEFQDYKDEMAFLREYQRSRAISITFWTPR